MKIKIIWLLLLFSSFAIADLPLSLDEIYTDKGKLKFESNVVYSNNERKENSYSEPIFIQTGVNSFVAIPTKFGQTRINTDIIIGSVGFRYGLTGKTDIYTNLSYLWQENRSFDGINETKQTEYYLYNTIFGISQTLLQDGENPALIGFIESSIYEKIFNKSFYAKSWLIGFSMYKAIDPIVLALTTAYRFNGNYNTTYGKYEPGNYLLLNPSVLFATNDRITLNGGLQWINRQAERLNDKKISTHNTATYAKFGIGLGINDDITCSLSTRFKISGESSSEINFGIAYNF